MLEQELYIANMFNSDYFTLRKYFHVKEVEPQQCEVMYARFHRT